uniref:Uncharacterized protein n=1 Tax=Arundo donax TaxID=35708 RepID=A0A0A8YLS8_ARUDO
MNMYSLDLALQIQSNISSTPVHHAEFG